MSIKYCRLIQTTIKTKAETVSIKALPFVKNFASQIFKTTKAIVS